MDPFEVLVNEVKHLVDKDEVQKLDFVEVSTGKYHIVKDNKSYNVEILDYNKKTKSFQLKVNNIIFNTSIQDKYDQLIMKMGLNKVTAIKVNEIKAQMPGMVLDVEVKEGDAIMIGDKLLILEAMKMENIIKSPGEGIIKKVHIQKGNAVEKGQLLIELE